MKAAKQKSIALPFAKPASAGAFSFVMGLPFSLCDYYYTKSPPKSKPTLGNISTKLGKGEMAACAFSAEAERHSLKRSSRVTTDWMS